MKRASAQALKVEFLEQLTAVATAVSRSASAAPPNGAQTVAVGVIPGSRPDAYGVGIRLPDPAWERNPAVRSLLHQAGDEVEARVVGPIRALTTSPGLLQQQLRTRRRPLVLGCSVSHPRVTAGTLGCFVRLAGQAGRAMLSNSHVLADSGAASQGDPILQPGVADGGNPATDRVATLHAFAPLAADRPNLADVAVALLDAEVEAEINRVPEGRLVGVTDEPPDDGQVAKLGRTTGHTQGTITLLEVDGLTVDYGGVTYSFNDAIEVEGAGSTSFSEGGDSGSVVYTRDLAGFGLLFAGSQSGGNNAQGLTYATSLSRAMALVGATLL